MVVLVAVAVALAVALAVGRDDQVDEIVETRLSNRSKEATVPRKRGGYAAECVGTSCYRAAFTTLTLSSSGFAGRAVTAGSAEIKAPLCTLLAKGGPSRPNHTEG